MTRTIIPLWTLLLATVGSSCASRLGGGNTPPTTGGDWLSIGRGLEFQPSPGKALSNDQQHALKHAQERFLKQQQQQQQQQQTNSRTAVDTQETYYDAYAQAWRYVGFYTDCSPGGDDQRRRLNGDEEQACQRYLLWAAYVDLDYDGKGIGNYQFYDTYTKQWDTSACEATGNGYHDEQGTFITEETTCKKMDCHLANTHMHLLGYFKEAEYTSWFEQLFKHEGYCVWQGDEYNFMYNNYGAWPEGCSATETYLSDGTLLYTDTTATANGTMGYGLYTDARCSVDYGGEEVTVEQVLNGNGDDNGDYLDAESLDYWNEAMEIYRVCQPCRAYALTQNYGGENRNRKRQLNGDEDDPNNGLFQCDDAAGYTNVNQCMKFASKTDMEYATFEEVVAAAHQGGITSLTIQGRTFGEFRAGYPEEGATLDATTFWSSVGVLAFGLVSFVGVLVWTCDGCRRSSKNASLNEPLMNHEEEK